MFKPNIPYLAFDDRRMMLFGIPLLALTLPFVFFGMDVPTFVRTISVEFWHYITFTFVYWMLNRYLIISLRKKYEGFGKNRQRLIVQLLIIIPAVPLISLILDGFCKGFYHDFLQLQDPFEPTFLQGILSTYVLTLSITALYEAIYFFYKYKEAIVEKEQIQRAHIQGQLDNLRNQINPHFLFNSLNTLMNLIPTDSERAMNYLSKLAKFYRYTVSKQEAPLVSLQTELENVRIYAELLQERFNKAIEITMPKTVSGTAEILPLSLQLLIENAVKHNILSHKKPLKIDIELSVDGTYIAVKNNVQKKIQEISSTGMGLKNIRNRVAFFTDAPLIVHEDSHSFVVSVPLIHSSEAV
jgi:hypothetical protein